MIWISSTILIVVEVLAIISAIHALFTVRTTQDTTAWVIGLLAFPWLALPFYWMFGCRQFHSYASAPALIGRASFHRVPPTLMKDADSSFSIPS